MISTEELISEATSLPVDIRVQLVEKLLQSLNPTEKETDELWAAEAERRVQEIETGTVIDLWYKEDRHYKVKRSRRQVKCKSRGLGIPTRRRKDAMTLGHKNSLIQRFYGTRTRFWFISGKWDLKKSRGAIQKRRGGGRLRSGRRLFH